MKKTHFPNLIKLPGCALLVFLLLVSCQALDNQSPSLSPADQSTDTSLLEPSADDQGDSSSIQGKVLDEGGNPISGATVRIKASEIETVSLWDGSFAIVPISLEGPFFISAFQPGYFINGIADVQPGESDVEIVLHAHLKIDNPDYTWMASTLQEGQGENQGCAQCHSSVGSALDITLPVDEWLLDAHSQSAQNQRFLSMYTGKNLDGSQSPLTRYGYSRDYGRFPLRPDLNQPYYGPGYKLDFPDTAGNCAACHIPSAAVNRPYSIDPSAMSGTAAVGIPCDFCHKVWDVNLDPATGLPYANMPGVLSYQFLRPPEGHQFFAGPYDDVAPGDDTYSPLQGQSQFCAGCHFGTFWDVTIYNSFGEWLESPYSNPQTGNTCQDCHMPPSGASYFALPDQGAVERDPQTIFSHRMPGASDELLLQNAVTLDAYAHIEGDQVILDVNILNNLTGHHVPTDSPLRQMILLVQCTDQAGSALSLLSGPTLPQWAGVGDPTSGYYAGLPGVAYAKILMELWTEVSPTGAYWNPTRILSDNRIPAFGSDASRYVFNAPAGSEITITVNVIYRRAFIELNDQKGWNVPDILMESETIELSTP